MAWMINFINNFSSIDILYISIILLSSILALLRGAVKEGLSLTKWILSALIAKNYVYLLDSYVQIKPFIIKQLVAFCLVFIVLSICFQIINIILNYFIKMSGIGLLNKLIGMLFGASRGLIIIAIISIIITTFIDKSYHIEQSQLYPIIEPILKLITEYQNLII